MSAPKATSQLEAIDGRECVRGASAGFTVLVIGGLAQFPVANIWPGVGAAWLPFVSAVAYFVAGRRIGCATRPSLHGMVSAVGAWGLVLPLRLLGGGLMFAAQIVMDLAIAAALGALAGAVVARSRAR